MLPPGGAISAKAKEEILKEKESPTPAPSEAPPTIRAEETEDEAVIRRPESKPPPPPATDIPGLSVLGGELPETDDQPQSLVLSTTEQTTNDELLVPLGSHGSVPGGEEGGDTTLYIGNEDDVVRSIDRPSKDGSRWVIEASGRRRRILDDTPEIPEKVRMLRGTMIGAIVCVVMAILQHFIVKDHKMPDTFIVIAVPGADESMGRALFYGLMMSVLMGFMQSAVLVARKMGPAVGFFLGGIGLGILAMLGSPNMPWSMITGMITGILIGRIAVKGVKRTVSV